MRSILLIAGTIIASSTMALAQHTTDVPKPVKMAFAKSYPGVSKVKWELEDGKYEAGFHYRKHEMSALYTTDGVLTETETIIAADSLPRAAREYATSRGKIQEAARIVKAGGEVQYEAEIKKRDLIFDSRGTIILEKTKKD